MATAVTAKVEHDYHGMGSIPQYTVKIDGLGGLSAAVSETVVNYAVSPFGEDMIILEAYMCITTVDADDADLDIGIADSAAAAGAEDNLFDSPANDTATVLKGIAVNAIAGVARPIWKAAGSATNSYITAQQNGNVDASSLVYNLLLVCAPYAKFKAT